MSASLSSGFASARKSSTPALPRDRRRRQRVVAGDHDRPDPHRPQPVEAVTDPALDDVLAVRRCRGCGARRRPGSACRPRSTTRSISPSSLGRDSPACAATTTPRWRRRPLADGCALRGPRPTSGSTRRRARSVHPLESSRPRRPNSPSPVRRSSAPPGSRRRATRAGPPRPAARSVDPRQPGGTPLACRFPRVIVPVLSSSSTLTSPAASTARPDIARTLCWRTRSIPAMPIAERSAADRRRDEADQQRDQHGGRRRRLRRRSRRAAASRSRAGRRSSVPRAGCQRDFVRRLLP